MLLSMGQTSPCVPIPVPNLPPVSLAPELQCTHPPEHLPQPAWGLRVSHVAVLHLSILWDLQQRQEREEKTPQFKPLRRGMGAGKASGSNRQLCRGAGWGGPEREPALGKGNFPVPPWREKQRGC